MFDFLFGKNKDQYASEYDTAIKNAKQDRADAAYNFRYNKALYDANKDYFDKIGVKDPSASYWNDDGQRTNDFTETMNQYGKYLNDLNKEKEDVAWKNRYNIFGDGAIGNMLNPFHQAGTAVQDFVSSGTKEWDNGNRDALSDLGAIGESALTVAPFVGAGAKVLRGGSAVANGMNTASKLGKAGSAVKSFTTAHPALAKIGRNALGMGGWSGLGALNEYGSDIGEHIPETAFRIGTGMAMGGLTGAAGYGLGKVWNKYTSSVDKDAISKAMSEYSKKNAPYQEALEKLKSEGITGDGDALNKAYRNWAKTNHPDVVGRSQAVALLPANAVQGSVEPAQLLSSEKVSQQALDNISGKAKANNPYIKANSFKTPVASYMKDVNDEIARNATEKFKTIQDAMEIVKAGRPAEFDISAIPRKKAANLVEALANLKNNLITTNPNGKLSRYGTNISNTTKNVTNKVTNSKVGTNVANLLKTKKGKLLFGGTAGLTLAGLMKNRNDNNTGQLSDKEMQELYNYVYGGQ